MERAVHFIIAVLSIVILCGTVVSVIPSCQPTKEDIEGPYYVPGAPFRSNSSHLCNLTDQGSNATMLIVKGRVTEEDCKTGIQALLDIWSANEEGEYSLLPGDYDCRAKMITDKQGYFLVHTVLPGRYLEAGGFRPAHVHWKISPLKRPKEGITTQLYFEHDPYLNGKDPCYPFCRSGDPTITMPLQYDHKHGNATALVRWNVVLQKHTIKG